MAEKLDLDALEEIAGKARVNGKAYLKIFHAIVDPETVSAMLARIRELEATASPADQVEPERREVCEVRDEHDQGGTWQNGYDTGWNECLDAHKKGA